MKPLNKYIDHTLLKPDATKEDIIKLCSDAVKYNFASVCVNPCNVGLAKTLLKNSDVKVCTVIGFPLGQNSTEIKVLETKNAYDLGCDEFDMVINVAKLKDGDEDYVLNEIKRVVTAANGKTVKVIIETGLLSDDEKITATKLVCNACANYVKTCTGFSNGIATVSDVALIKRNITGNVKIKASAGIKTRKDALALIDAGADRIGASSGVKIVTEN